MEEKQVLSNTVILIDVPFLNAVIFNLRKHFEFVLRRPLQEIDLSDLLVYLALDAGVKKTNDSVQVVFVYDESSSDLINCRPSSLEHELNNVAFKDDEMGEFILNSYQPELMVTRQQLYTEFVNVLLNTEQIKKYILVFSLEEYGNEFTQRLREKSEKNIIEFCLDNSGEESWKKELLAYPIMQALGIKGEEIN